MNFLVQKQDPDNFCECLPKGTRSMIRQLKPLKVAFHFGKFPVNNQRQRNRNTVNGS